MVSKSSAPPFDCLQISGSPLEYIGANQRAWLLWTVQQALLANRRPTGSSQVLSTVRAEARSSSLSAFAEDFRANGIEAVDRHLGRLMAAVRQPGAPQVERVLDGICDGCAGCPQSSMVCPMRACGTCIVLRDIDTILSALAKALWEVRDPQYLQNHPDGTK